MKPNRVQEVFRRYETKNPNYFSLHYRTEDGQRHDMFRQIPRDLDMFFQGDEALGLEILPAYEETVKVLNELGYTSWCEICGSVYKAGEEPLHFEDECFK